VPSPPLAPGAIDLRVSAAFKGALLRSQSADVLLMIVPRVASSLWTTLSDTQRLFSLKVPPQWQLLTAEKLNPDQYALKNVNFLFPDGTSAFYITVYTVTNWHTAISDDVLMGDLLGQNQYYVFTVTEGQDIEPIGYSDSQVRGVLPQVFATFSIN
jgi:hypothetical protein